MLSIPTTMRDALLSNHAPCLIYLQTLESSPVIPSLSLKGTYVT